MSENISSGASNESSHVAGESKVTFTVHPIETAPKDRAVMLFCRYRGKPRKWLLASWEFGAWHDRYCEHVWDATHWAEIEEMKP